MYTRMNLCYICIHTQYIHMKDIPMRFPLPFPIYLSSLAIRQAWAHGKCATGTLRPPLLVVCELHRRVPRRDISVFGANLATLGFFGKCVIYVI